MAGTCSVLCVIIITLFIPPLGVFMISGCSADFFINILLTILGYFPGHIHAFYLEYVYYKRKNNPTMPVNYDAPGVYSQRIKTGGRSIKNYAPAPNAPNANYPPPSNGGPAQGYPPPPNGPGQNYGPNYGPNYGTVS